MLTEFLRRMQEKESFGPTITNINKRKIPDLHELYLLLFALVSLTFSETDTTYGGGSWMPSKSPRNTHHH